MRQLSSCLAALLGLAALAPPAVAQSPSVPAVTAPAVLGVDVSRYQGSVDYQKLRAGGYSYCFIKATQGMTYVDPRYASDLVQARAAGLAPGSYHFFVTGDAAPAQFENFVAQVRLAPGDLPPVVDIEQLSGEGPELVSELAALLDLLEAHYRVTPILYSGLQFANEHLRDFERYPLWVAEYEVPAPRVPDGFTRWTFWQYSEHGRVDGIADEVDLDRFFGTPEQFRTLLFAAAPTAAAPPAVPAPSASARSSPHFTPLPPPASTSPGVAQPASQQRLAPSVLWSTLIALCCLGFAAWRIKRRHREQASPGTIPSEAATSSSEHQPADPEVPTRAPHPPPLAPVQAPRDTRPPALSEEPPAPTPLERYTRSLSTSTPAELETRLDAIHALARLARTTPDTRSPVVQALSRFVKDHVERTSPGAPPGPPRPLRADLEMALCRLVELGGLLLPGADLHGTQLEHASLEHADLSGANLAGANLQGAKLRQALLFGANLQGAFLQGAALDGARMGGAFLGGAFLAGASLSAAELQGAFLQAANLPGADLHDANLSGAVAPGAHLPGARLEDAKLLGANLQSANLQGADLRSARLDQTNLSGSRLDGARLQGANVEAALGVAQPREPSAPTKTASRTLA